MAKKRFLFNIPLLIVTATLLTGCARLSSPEINEKLPEVPYWFNSPSQGNNIGVIGIARDLDVGNGNPVQFSRYRALLGTQKYLNKPLAIERQDIDINENSYNISNNIITFSNEFRMGGYVYSYAAINHQASEQQGAIAQCDFSKCNPAWLCDPGADKIGKNANASLLGTSYRSVTLPAQYKAAINNALQQLEPIYGLSVNSHDLLYNNNSSVGNVRILLSNSNLKINKEVDNIKLRYLVENSCRQGEQLFLRVNFPDLPALSDIPAKKWLNEPSSGGYKGAIGSVQGRVASGLLSDKIKLAIKRGLIELAKAKNTRVNEELLTIRHTENIYQVSFINQNTDITLYAKVNGIYFNEGPKGTEVYAWLVETNSEYY